MSDWEFRNTVAPTITLVNIDATVFLITGAKRYFRQRFVIAERNDLVEPA